MKHMNPLIAYLDHDKLVEARVVYKGLGRYGARPIIDPTSHLHECRERVREGERERVFERKRGWGRGEGEGLIYIKSDRKT
jgi:hypothetical protein